MIWKFPSRLPPVYMEEIHPETMQEVAQDQIKSTYQSDYTGIPQGKCVKKCSPPPLIAQGGYTPMKMTGVPVGNFRKHP